MVEAFLTLHQVFGEELPRRADFTGPELEALADIAGHGVLEALRRRSA